MAVSEPRLVVLSAGRSGSGYIAQVLTRAGLPCGHEAYYNLTSIHETDRPAESSWLALPRLEEGALGGVPAVHQVRHPLKVLSSLMNGVLLRTRGQPYRRFREEHTGDPAPPYTAPASDWLAWFARHLLEWNQRCQRVALERGGFTYRVEAVTTEHVLGMFELAGERPDPGRIRRAVRHTPNRVNQHGRGPEITWSDLPALEAVRLQRWAVGVGYTISRNQALV